jgi:hypothetical protein
MPLIKSGSKQAISQNIREMMHAGHPQKQAIAAAYATARKYGRQRGGAVDDYATIGPGAPQPDPITQYLRANPAPPQVPLPRPNPRSPADYPTPNWLRGDRIAAYGGRIGYADGGGDDEGVVPKQDQTPPTPSVGMPGQQSVSDYLGQAYRSARNYLTQEPPPTTAQTAAPGKIPSENPYTAGVLSTGTDILTSLINPEMAGVGAAAKFGAGMLIPPGAKAASEGAGRFFLKSAKALEEMPETRAKLTGADYEKQFLNKGIKKEEMAWTVGPYLQHHANEVVSKDDLRRVIDDTGRYLDFTIREYPNRFGHSDVQPGTYTQEAGRNYSFPGGIPGSYKEWLFQLPSRDRSGVQPSPEIAAKYAPQIKELEDRVGPAVQAREQAKAQYEAQMKVLKDRMHATGAARDPVSQSIYSQTSDEYWNIREQMRRDPRVAGGQTPEEQQLELLKGKMIDDTIALSGSPASVPPTIEGKPNKDYYLPTLGNRPYVGHTIHFARDNAAGEPPTGVEPTTGFGAHKNPNIFGHLRFDEIPPINGKKTLRLHESQSDLHQDARIGPSYTDKGYLNVADPAGQSARFRQAYDEARFADQSKNDELAAAMKAQKPPVEGEEYRYSEDPKYKIEDLQRGYQINRESPRSQPEALSRQINAIRTEYGDDIAKQAQDYIDKYYSLRYGYDRARREFAPNTPWKWSSPSSTVDTLMFRALLHHAVENGYEQIALPEGSEYWKKPHGPYSATSEHTQNGIEEYYNKVYPRKMNQEVLEKAGVKDARWGSDVTPQQIKSPEQVAADRQKFIDAEMRDLDSTYPPDEGNPYVTDARERNLRRIQREADEKFDPSSGNTMHYRILPITEQLKAAVKDPKNSLHSAFRRGGGVMQRAGGGFAGSTPWFVRQEARGMVHGGMLGGSGMGRTDTLPINVPSGAYVVPADIVSGIGHGNSAGGASILAKAFGTGPLGMPAMHAHGGFGGPKNIRMGMMKMPKGSSTGSVGFAEGGAPGHTPIVAASGEFVIHPDAVRAIGKGDVKRGHDVLDKLMIDLRKKHVKTLQKLPGPVKRASGGRVPDISSLLARISK